MKSDKHTTPEFAFDCLPIGIIALDITSLQVQYMNRYARLQFEEHWHSQPILGCGVQSLLATETCDIILPHLRQLASSKECKEYKEVPYEGFFGTRGKTYWHITIQRLQAHMHHFPTHGDALFVSFEDVTYTVRSRLLLEAIHHVSSTIAGAHTLPFVLDSILDAVHTLVGSNHCTILLIDRFSSQKKETDTMSSPPAVNIAAQRGMYSTIQEWTPSIDQQLLFGQVVKEHSTLAITDTHVTPHLQFPHIECSGKPQHPGAVLCVPIYEPTLAPSASTQHKEASVIGCIEVYHAQPRIFPQEEVELLEKLAVQAGLAIQNARLFQNVDQLARAERRSARRQAHIMQALPDGIIIVDPRWRIAETNHAIRVMMGWPHEHNNLLGLPLHEALQQSRAILPPLLMGSTDPIAFYEQKALSNHIDEFEMTGADGQVYTMRCTYTPICDDIGDTLAFIVTYHDVTEQAIAQERVEAEVVARTQELAQRNVALQQAQYAQQMERAQLELLLERLPSSIFLISAHDTSIMTINNDALKLLHLIGVPLSEKVTPKQLVGTDYEELFRAVTMYGSTGSPVPLSQQPLALALHEGKATELELHTQGEEGQTLYLLVNAAPLRASNGTITSAILVLHDITNLKMLEHAREDFFTTMAHELKTPLANVRAHLSALLENDIEWSPQDQRNFIQTADEQIERLVGMINHVLDASRVEAGALRLHLEPVVLSELIEDLQEQLSALIASSHRRLEVLLPPQFLVIEADYNLMLSVLTNLLSNAFRYAPEGDAVTLAVTVEQQQQKGGPTDVTFSVRDRGPGIPLDQQKHLFTRFSTFAAFSRSSHTSMDAGTARWSPTSGLGLYISRGIVEAHNSTLRFTSEPDQGTCFWFTLPLMQHKKT